MPRYTAAQRVRDYRIVFGSDEGQRVLRDLVARGWVLSGTLHENSHITAHREGERNMVLEIMRVLQLRPEDVRDIVADVDDQFKDEVQG